MTEFEANRLVLTLSMNFAKFMPLEIEAAAVKRGMWMRELAKYDFKKALEAVNDIVQTLPYPPTLYDLKSRLGYDPDLTRDEMQARLPGPTFGTPEGYKAMYTADMSRVDRLMAALDNELRTGKFTKTREEALNTEEP